MIVVIKEINASKIITGIGNSTTHYQHNLGTKVTNTDISRVCTSSIHTYNVGYTTVLLRLLL